MELQFPEDAFSDPDVVDLLRQVPCLHNPCVTPPRQSCYSDAQCCAVLRLAQGDPKFLSDFQLLNRKPSERPNSVEIKEHAFFADIDWDALYR